VPGGKELKTPNLDNLTIMDKLKLNAKLEANIRLKSDNFGVSNIQNV